MYDVARIRRTAAKGGDKHTVFRIGEVHGTVTKRVEELVEMFKVIDSAKATTNLWGERWSKLSQNGMRNGVCSVTGLTSAQCDKNPACAASRSCWAAKPCASGRRSATSSRRCTVSRPRSWWRRPPAAPTRWRRSRSFLASHAKENPRGDMQFPSMAQDIRKGRRTEIEFMNGLIVEKGKQLGIPTPNHEKLVELVKKLERGEIKPSPAHLGG